MTSIPKQAYFKDDRVIYMESDIVDEPSQGTITGVTDPDSPTPRYTILNEQTKEETEIDQGLILRRI